MKKHAISTSICALALAVCSQFTLAAKPCPPASFGVEAAGNSQTSINDCGKVVIELPAAVGDLRTKVDAMIDASWIEEAGNDVEAGYIRWPAIDGLIDLYIATDDVKYVRLAVDMSIAYARAGAHIDGDGYLDWHSPHVPQWNNINHYHYEWRAAAGIAKTVGLLATREELKGFAGQRNELVAFLETHVWDKWDYPGHLSHITDFSSESTIFIGRIGVIAIGLHQATGKDRYLDYLNTKGVELVDSLIAQYNPNKDAYNLTLVTDGSDGTGDAGVGTVDTSHAGDAFSFLTQAYFEGYDLSGKLTTGFMHRLTNTVTEVMWPDADWSYYVNGTGSGGWPPLLNGGFARLAAFDSALQVKYVNWALDPNTFGSSFPWPFEEVRTYGALARASVLLRENPSLANHTE